jgi:hypothetical protein
LLRPVVVRVEGGSPAEPAVLTGIVDEVGIDGEAPDDKLDALVRFVDEITEIPNSPRQGTSVGLWRSGRSPE